MMGVINSIEWYVWLYEMYTLLVSYLDSHWNIFLYLSLSYSSCYCYWSLQNTIDVILDVGMLLIFEKYINQKKISDIMCYFNSSVHPCMLCICHSIILIDFGGNVTKIFWELISCVINLELVLNEFHGTVLILNQHWFNFRQWLGAIQAKAITWANVDPDLCHHMVTLCHNELNMPCTELYRVIMMSFCSAL